MQKILILCLGLSCASVYATADPVLLRDGTQLDDAVIVRLQPATYLVQSSNTLYELSEDELDPSTLDERDFRLQPAPFISRNFDQIHADGGVSAFHSSTITNDGRRAITELRWGLAPWEREVVDARSYIDHRGIQLHPRYDPPREEWPRQPEATVRLILPLAVPLAPGEEMTLTTRETLPAVAEDDLGFHYRHNGDYPEDRLVWRKVSLPRGAHVVVVTPDPSARFTVQGREYIVWRQFYRAGEVRPLEVVYRLD
jgi:hypothetical protein